MASEQSHKPEPRSSYIPASTELPEITIKGVILGVLLSAILGAANTYLGLFAGMTVSASIPAAVISMAVLRLFRESNILENNAVQTAASAGESLAAGVIFTFPALIILGTWAKFDYWETTMIAGFGGILGVLFSIPLRRALIVEQPLQFPEGVATAEVLKVGEQGGGGIRHLATAGLVGGLFKLGGAGFKLWEEAFEKASYFVGSIAYIGSNLSPALVGVGYIVGLNIAVLIFLGGAVNWFVAIPIVASMAGIDPTVAAVDAAGGIWSAQTRYLGVGAMIVGGLWALIRIRSSLVSGIASGIAAYKHMRDGGEVPLRTERDAPMQWVGGAIVFCVVPLFFIFNHFTHTPWVSAVMAVVMLVAGFLFSAVAAYMAGLVGSSNNPISGVTIGTILTSSLLLLAMLGGDSPIGPAAAIFIGAVVCCAAAISGDNMQDLKAGHVLGSTPIKQQIMQVVGVLAAAVVMAPILSLLLTAYGIGTPTEAHPSPLSAPQATLMASVAGGVFRGGLPWNMVIVGMAIAIAVIIIDLILEAKKSSFRMPVLAFAVGIYLPFQLSVPIFLGGLIAFAAGRVRAGLAARGDAAKLEAAHAEGAQDGLLFAAGLITGEAMVGILLAIPIAATANPAVLAVFGTFHHQWPGVLLLAGVIYGLYRVATAPLRRLE